MSCCLCCGCLCGCLLSGCSFSCESCCLCCLCCCLVCCCLCCCCLCGCCGCCCKSCCLLVSLIDRELETYESGDFPVTTNLQKLDGSIIDTVCSVLRAVVNGLDEDLDSVTATEVETCATTGCESPLPVVSVSCCRVIEAIVDTGTYKYIGADTTVRAEFEHIADVKHSVKAELSIIDFGDVLAVNSFDLPTGDISAKTEPRAELITEIKTNCREADSVLDREFAINSAIIIPGPCCTGLNTEIPTGIESLLCFGADAEEESCRKNYK